MAYDYSKLRGRIIENFGSCAAFAHIFPMSERTLSLKLTCKRSWSQRQIVRACELLEIDQCDMPEYFFKLKV